jgi:hypothetical protein
MAGLQPEPISMPLTPPTLPPQAGGFGFLSATRVGWTGLRPKRSTTMPRTGAAELAAKLAIDVHLAVWRRSLQDFGAFPALRSSFSRQKTCLRADRIPDDHWEGAADTPSRL